MTTPSSGRAGTRSGKDMALFIFVTATTNVRHRSGRSLTRLGRLTARGVLLVMSACSGGVLDAGVDHPHGLLPVDERSPIVLLNDNVYDNWQGEYALLLAGAAGPAVAGIVISASGYWPDLDANIAGWAALVAAARSSGMQDIPDPVSSNGPPLTMPTDGDVDATVPNRSEGAQQILALSASVGPTSKPLAIVTGGRLTDVADAYLMDHSVTNRVIVISSLGKLSSSGAAMGPPNGELDPWADAIVATHFRYIQVSAYYDQTADVPSSRVPDLPANAFGAWIAAKQSGIKTTTGVQDQVGVIALGIPDFVSEVSRVLPGSGTPASSKAGPSLVADQSGGDWLVTRSAGGPATARFWQILLDPKTFGP
jgi:hypothetical protein